MPSTTIRHNGSAIRAFRVKAGLKPGEFATKVRLSYQHIDNIENERKQASAEVLHRIAAALEIPISAILREATAFDGSQRETAPRRIPA